MEHGPRRARRDQRVEPVQQPSPQALSFPDQGVSFPVREFFQQQCAGQGAVEIDALPRPVGAPVKAPKVLVSDRQAKQQQHFNSVTVAEGRQGVAEREVIAGVEGHTHATRGGKNCSALLYAFEFDRQVEEPMPLGWVALEPAADADRLVEVQAPGGGNAINAGGGNRKLFQSNGSAAQQEKTRQGAGDRRAPPAAPQRKDTKQERNDRQRQQHQRRVVHAQKHRQPRRIRYRYKEKWKPHGCSPRCCLFAGEAYHQPGGRREKKNYSPRSSRTSDSM